jgi:hypothetical protein
MLSIIIRELAKEHGWSDEHVIKLFRSFIERKGQKLQEELVSYLVKVACSQLGKGARSRR